MILQLFPIVVKCDLVNTQAQLTEVDTKQRIENECPSVSQKTNSWKLLDSVKSLKKGNMLFG